MIPPLALPARGLALLALLGAPAAAQLPPLIGGLDEHTVALGQFEGGAVDLVDARGSKLVKSTASSGVPGVYGTTALAMPPSGIVSIHESAGFDPRQGTLELWLRVPGVSEHRRGLFTVEGVNTLDGDKYNDLFIGQAVNGDPVWSEVRFGTASGPSATDVALIKTFMPRGVSAGDIDGDGQHDLVISQNQIDEVHVFEGPIRPGFVYDVPVDPARRLSVPVPQGHAVADLDNDGDLDMLVCSYDADTEPIFGFANDGQGNFSPLPFDFGGVTAFAEGMAVGDVNNDGLLDVAYGSLDTAVPSAVFLGRIVHAKYSIGILDQAFYSQRSPSVLGVSLADVDEDGWLDVLLARTFDDEIAVHINRTNGDFLNVPNFTIPCTRPFTVTASEDVNNDGHVDVAVAQWKDVTQNTSESRVFLGPDFSQSIPFPVQDAVSMTLGDMDGNGTTDVFWRSSTSTTSRYFTLDEDGGPIASTDMTTTITTPGTAGPGMGVFASIGGGTSPYTTILDRSNSFELYLVGEQVVFAITDRTGRTHEVSAPFINGGPTQGGWRHVRAEWNTAAGRMALRVLPDQGSGAEFELLGPRIPVTLVHPWMRLGTGVENQQPCRNCRFDDVRVSDVERSSL